MDAKEAIKIIKGEPFYKCNFPELEISQALLLAISALEKQVPKEPTAKGLDAKTGDWTICCPNCDAKTQGTRIKPNYCANCGQKIDWNEEDD